MKKFAAILLASFYMLTSSGLVIGAQYCGQHVTNLSFHVILKADCPNPSMHAKADHCCKVVNKFVKIGQKHFTTNFNYKFNNQAITISLPVFKDHYRFYPETAQVIFINGPPDRLSVPDLFLQNCSFRI